MTRAKCAQAKNEGPSITMWNCTTCQQVPPHQSCLNHCNSKGSHMIQIHNPKNDIMGVSRVHQTMLGPAFVVMPNSVESGLSRTYVSLQKVKDGDCRVHWGLPGAPGSPGSPGFAGLVKCSGGSRNYVDSLRTLDTHTRLYFAQYKLAFQLQRCTGLLQSLSTKLTRRINTHLIC